MASIIWDRDPQEAMDNPYEYNAQKQFQSEANVLFEKLSISKRILLKSKFYLNDYSLEKATGMLQIDALFIFKNCLDLLEDDNHKLTGRLFRDILESIHLIEYFNTGTDKSIKAIESWYQDEVIMHGEYRSFIKKREGEHQANYLRDIHRIFSKFTHKSYKTLLYGYMLGGKDSNELKYDNKWTLQQSVSMHYAYVGYFGRLIVSNLKNYGVLSVDEVETDWNGSMEKEQIPRGFLSEDDKAFLGISD